MSRSRRAIVAIAGGVLIVVGLLGLVAGAGLVAIGVLSALSNDGHGGGWPGLGAGLGVAGIVYGSAGLAGVVSGVGVWAGRSWGRVLGVLIAGLGLVLQGPLLVGRRPDASALIGVILSGYVLVALVVAWRPPKERSSQPSDPHPRTD